VSTKPLRLIPPLHRATHRIGLYIAEGQAETLSQGESHILALLAASSPMTIRALHDGLAHKRSTLTSILDRLAARRLITRSVGEDDRRTFVVSLTARGRRVASDTLRHLTDLERTVSTRVSEADVQAFSRVVAAIESEARNHTRSESRRGRSSRGEYR
jgi:DNA-binding MarR family transcriptional regulator